jgi:hypothetical protein
MLMCFELGFLQFVSDLKNKLCACLHVYDFVSFKSVGCRSCSA